jgi:hypothetical protein
MYLQKVINKTTVFKNLFFVGILPATDEKSRIRIQIRIRSKMSRTPNTALYIKGHQQNKYRYQLKALFRNGYGVMIFFRIRISIKVSDPSKSRSTTLFTVYRI